MTITHPRLHAALHLAGGAGALFATARLSRQLGPVLGSDPLSATSVMTGAFLSGWMMMLAMLAIHLFAVAAHREFPGGPALVAERILWAGLGWFAALTAVAGTVTVGAGIYRQPLSSHTAKALLVWIPVGVALAYLAGFAVDAMTHGSRKAIRIRNRRSLGSLRVGE